MLSVIIFFLQISHRGLKKNEIDSKELVLFVLFCMIRVVCVVVSHCSPFSRKEILTLYV